MRGYSSRLYPRDTATLTEQTVNWVVQRLLERGVDADRVAVRGFDDLDQQAVTIVVHERLNSPGSRRRPVPDPEVARILIRHSDLLESGRRAWEIVQDLIDKLPAHLLQGPVLLPVSPRETYPEPTPEDQEEVQRILAESRARRDRRLATRRDGASGTRDRTTGTP